MQASESLDRFLPVDEVEHISGYSRTTIWRHEREGLFPRRVKIGKARVGWPRCHRGDHQRSQIAPRGDRGAVPAGS